MDFANGPMETNEPTGFEPLEWDDEVYDEDDVYGDPYEDEDDYEEPGLGGWDDLKPFSSFDDESSWSEGFL